MWNKHQCSGLGMTQEGVGTEMSRIKTDMIYLSRKRGGEKGSERMKLLKHHLGDDNKLEQGKRSRTLTAIWLRTYEPLTKCSGGKSSTHWGIRRR